MSNELTQDQVTYYPADPAPASPMASPFGRDCIRAGRCCRVIVVAYSPRALRESWLGWRRGTLGPDKPANFIADIDLVYPMTVGRCRGKRRVWAEGADKSSLEGSWLVYIYGPCRNLDLVLQGGKALPTCALHDNKPAMCRDYPFYGKAKNAEKPNPGYMQGCGYNRDDDSGGVESEMIGELEPLGPEDL